LARALERAAERLNKAGDPWPNELRAQDLVRRSPKLN
jgi:hypothetical protein